VSAEPAGVVVRGAVAADAPAVAVLLTELGYPSTADEVAGRLAYWVEDPSGAVLVASDDVGVVGCISVHTIPYLARTGRWARIESLVVAGRARGRGIGAALVAAAESFASSRGCLAVEVTSSRPRTDAHAFYRSIGFTDVCDRSGRFWKELPPSPPS
jgi:GNAT superfamily N-acetyltransferase